MALLLRRPLVVVAMLLVMLLAGWWWRTGDDVTWSVQVDGAAHFYDADEGRVLVGNQAGDLLIVLDRRTGEELVRWSVPDDRRVEQVALVPGGLLVNARPDDPDDPRIHTLSQVDRDGQEAWSREVPGRPLLRGIDDGVAAYEVPGATGALVGVDLASGEDQWRLALSQAEGPGSYLEGAALREAHVSVVGIAEAPGLSIVDLADGSVLARVGDSEDFDEVAYWQDSVLLRAMDEPFVLYVGGVRDELSVEGGPVPASFLLTTAAGVAAWRDGDGRLWSVDLVSGRVGPVTQLATGSTLSSEAVARTVVAVDGTVAVGVDAGSGEELFRRESRGSLTSVGSGAEAALVEVETGLLRKWRHGTGGDDDADRLELLDRDGDVRGVVQNGTYSYDAAEVLRDGVGAVVVTRDDDGEDRVVLLGD